MATESAYMIPAGDTADNFSLRKKLALALAQKTMQTPQIDHWAQGLAHLGESAYSGYEIGKINREDKEETANGNELMARLLGGGGSSAPAAAAASATSSTGNAGDAIASIESGGKYDALGPVTKTGDRAYGKYQVMGANIPEWSQAALGQKLTPQQFLADPKAQDSVFNHRFGQYTSKYGPEGAARAWFAGEGGMNDLGRKDQLGTTVGSYGQKFAQALGQPAQAAAPVQTAQAGQPNRELLIQMLGNRHTRPMAQQILGAQIQQQMKPQTTDEIKEFEYTQRNPAFKDYKTDLKKAGAQNISIDQRGENAFAKEAGSQQAKRFNEIAQGGQDAQAMIGDLNALREIGGRITTGKTAEIQNAIGPYAEALGIKMDGLDDMQAYSAIVAKIAPRMRVPGSGATSDFEMQNFLKALPGLGKTPGGNEIIANTLEAVQQHKVAAAEIASRAMAGEITPKDAEKELRALPDPMTLWKKQGKSLAAPAPQAAPPASAKQPPQPGLVQDGYRFKGGNPADQKNWEKL